MLDKGVAEEDWKGWVCVKFTSRQLCPFFGPSLLYEKVSNK